MPWKDLSVVSIREQFVVRAEVGPNVKLAAICRDYGISRKTGYKWIERYKQDGVLALRAGDRMAGSGASSLVLSTPEVLAARVTRAANAAKVFLSIRLDGAAVVQRLGIPLQTYRQLIDPKARARLEAKIKEASESARSDA